MFGKYNNGVFPGKIELLFQVRLWPGKGLNIDYKTQGEVLSYFLKKCVLYGIK